jgi:hypothetical protein
MSLVTRKMLTLQKDSVLSEEEIWLKNAYANIVLNLVKAALTIELGSSEFDPFISKFMGMDTVKYNKYRYRAFLEVTSYFWASKGGRGILLEKIFASLGGIYSASNVTLYEIIARIMKKNNSLQTANQDIPQFLMKGGLKKLKFDLVNIVNDSLIILELKNRVEVLQQE